MANGEATPGLEIYDHSGAGGIDLDWLKRRATEAMPRCLAHPGTEPPVLPELAEVEVSLITDDEIARIHGEFMDDPTATDVITFHHGEILISLDTASREAPSHGHSTAGETLLYLIHGLLHLNGHTDLSEPERAAMHSIQEEILGNLGLGESEI